ncbi:MAG: TolC family protein [Gemmatimonadetes bacterium]|nr:TolC family protein [Gemmatimonadota bacterium]MDA1104866.1 TolC family protein [Gemmatimonadota bacterium]
MSVARERLIVAAVAVVIFGIPVGVGGQQSEPVRLSLAEALDLAAGSNPALRQATNSTLLNGVEMRSAWLDQVLPRASLTLFDTGFTGNLQRQALDDFGNPIARPTANWNYFSRTTHNLALRWSFQGPSLFQAHNRQQLLNEDRELGLVRALTDVQIGVQRLYIDALEQRELQRAEEELIEARAIDLDVAERMFSLALKTRVDVLNAELAVEQQTLALRRQEAAFQRALLALETAMGVSDIGAIELVDEELPIFDPATFQVEELVARALGLNPALMQSEVAVNTARAGVAEQNASWWPEISMGVDLFRRSFSQAGQALFDPPGSRDLESQFFMNFSFPLLDGYFQQSVARQRASVELSNQREGARQARLELEATVRGALLDLENQWESYRLSERSNVIADEALRLAREEYRLGTRSFEELRSSFQQEADTRRQIITSRHTFVEALLVLEEAVGGSVREMIPGSGGEAGD